MERRKKNIRSSSSNSDSGAKNICDFLVKHYDHAQSKQYTLRLILEEETKRKQMTTANKMNRKNITSSIIMVKLMHMNDQYHRFFLFCFALYENTLFIFCV